jgi:hypothetical protein
MSLNKTALIPNCSKTLTDIRELFFCRHLHETLGLIIQYAGVGSAAHKDAQRHEYKLKVRLKKLGFSQQIATSLPTVAPTKPSGCQ